MTDATSIKSITEELPLSVRAGLARSWVLALALDYSLSSQPKDNLPEALWSIGLLTEDLVDVGVDAFLTLSDDIAELLIEESANAAMVCSSCLAQLIYGEDEEGQANG